MKTIYALGSVLLISATGFLTTGTAHAGGGDGCLLATTTDAACKPKLEAVAAVLQADLDYVRCQLDNIAGYATWADPNMMTAPRPPFLPMPCQARPQ